MSERASDGPAAASPGETPRRRWSRRLLWLTFLIGLSAPLLVLVGAVGTKLGLWDWRVGFLAMTVQTAPKAAFLGVAAGVAALGLMFLAGWRRTWWLAALSLLVPVATVAAFGAVRAGASAVPPIHDYATDWSEPIMPSPALLTARGPAANPVEPDPRADLGQGRPEVENWADDRVARIGAEACSGARPVRLPAPPAQAQSRVRQVLQAEGLRVGGEAPGRVEATWESFWYGFKDDVIVRVRPDGVGSRVDLRSVSRVGVSDLGANCARVTALVSALETSPPR